MSEDLIVIREDRIVLDGREPTTHASSVADDNPKFVIPDNIRFFYLHLDFLAILSSEFSQNLSTDYSVSDNFNASNSLKSSKNLVVWKNICT